MRPRLEKALMSFSEVAKEDVGIDASTENNEQELTKNLSAVIDWQLKKAAGKQRTSFEIQKEIYGIQKEKQKIMADLKKKLACLDDPDCEIERQDGERSTKFDHENNGFIYNDDNGREGIATLGELMTDMEFGLFYYLDKDSTPRMAAKKYFVERAKKELMELLNRQIVKSEMGGKAADSGRKAAYGAIKERQEGNATREQLGFVSESMIKNFFKKLSIDQNASFQISDADVFQDVEQKIDFVIHRKKRERGVSIETDDGISDIGIQITTNPFSMEHKKRQIESAKKRLDPTADYVKDIVLVLFPQKIVKALYSRWKENGRPAGGPDKFLYRSTAEKIFKEIIGGILSPREIEDYWEGVQNNFPEK